LPVHSQSVSLNKNRMSTSTHELDAPSPWVCRWAGLIPAAGRVLDVACGHGRHLRYLRGRGFAVVGIDRDEAALSALKELAGAELHVADIEAGAWPFTPQSFDGVVVTNYLHRPLFPKLIGALRRGGVLIYETFAAGNERYGRPSNPDFVLRQNELLERVELLSVIAFEQGRVARPKGAVIQRVCAVRDGTEALLLDPE
jgi:SAM-dependent methyltransferase